MAGRARDSRFGNQSNLHEMFQGFIFATKQTSLHQVVNSTETPPCVSLPFYAFVLLKPHPRSHPPQALLLLLLLLQLFQTTATHGMPSKASLDRPRRVESAQPRAPHGRRGSALRPKKSVKRIKRAHHDQGFRLDKTRNCRKRQ